MTIKTFQTVLTTATPNSRILTSLRKIADVEASDRYQMTTSQAGWFDWGG